MHSTKVLVNAILSRSNSLFLYLLISFWSSSHLHCSCNWRLIIHVHACNFHNFLPNSLCFISVLAINIFSKIEILKVSFAFIGLHVFRVSVWLPNYVLLYCIDITLGVFACNHITYKSFRVGLWSTQSYILFISISIARAFLGERKEKMVLCLQLLWRKYDTAPVTLNCLLKTKKFRISNGRH